MTTVQHLPYSLALLLVTVTSLVAVPPRARAESGSKDIVDTAVSAGNFNTLLEAVKAASLVETLKSSGPFTVFAPSDDAFKRLPADTLKSLLQSEHRDRLAAILTYHVVPGRVSARQAFGLDNAATVNGQRIEICRSNGKLVVDGANLVATDINCSNGVIHVIDQVLLPEQERIPSLAKKTNQFNTLLAAVATAGLGQVLDGAGPLTVFAPTDEAFDALPEGTVESLLKPENKQKLVDILKNHVVSGRVYSDQVAAAGQVRTLLGSLVETSVSADGLRINDSRVVLPDLESANGVIHAIDSVLLPRPMGPRQAMRVLEDAIRRGVPVFNDGNHHECAEIYMAACQMIGDSGSDEMPHGVVSALQKAVARAKRMHHAGSRAWTLRHGMDSALAGLREMSLANVGGDSR